MADVLCMPLPETYATISGSRPLRDDGAGLIRNSGAGFALHGGRPELLRSYVLSARRAK